MSLAWQISEKAKRLISLLLEKKLNIAFAESVTGGLMAASLIREEKASEVISVSFITYSEIAKKEVLNVKQATLEQEGVYSQSTVKEMLLGLKVLAKADVLVSVSGIAGIKAVKDHQRGETYLGISVKGISSFYQETFEGTRQEIQEKIVLFTFNELIELLQK